MRRSFNILTCRWVARRAGRHLDADPSALLDPAEIRRLEAHLQVCAFCHQRIVQYRELAETLHAAGRGIELDTDRIDRVREAARYRIDRSVD